MEYFEVNIESNLKIPIFGKKTASRQVKKKIVLNASPKNKIGETLFKISHQTLCTYELQQTNHLEKYFNMNLRAFLPTVLRD